MSKKKKTERPLPQSLNLPACGVESHAHLDMPGSYDEDLAQVLVNAAQSGIVNIGNVFLGPAAYQAGRAKFEHEPQVFFLLGVHPHDAAAMTPQDLSDMEAAFGADPRLKALGEIGLDYFYDRSPREVQAEAFKQQLELARQKDLPVALHCREAEMDALAILLDLGFKDRKLLWHCFGGDAELAARIQANGWSISLPGPLTYKKNVSLHEAVSLIDLSRLLLETDCPYLAPEPWRGQRNEPALMAFTAQAAARLKGLETAEIWRIAGDNAREFFRL